MLVAAKSYSHHFQQDDATSSIDEHISHARSRRCTDIEEWARHHGPEDHPAPFALRVKSSGLPYVMRSLLRVTICSLRSSTLVHGFPARPGPHCAQYSATSVITLTWNFEAADSVQACLLSQMTPDMSTWNTEWDLDAWPQCEACLSIFYL